MKKILLIFISILLLVPIFVFANTKQLATLINTKTGKKIVVEVGAKFPSSDWQLYRELGARTVIPPWSYNELSTIVKIGSFADATTTVISVANPFLATSTIDLFFYNQTGAATSTYTLSCSTSSTAFATPSGNIVSTGNIATSSLAYLANGITYGAGFTSVGSNKLSIIAIGPSEYFVCKTTVVYPAGNDDAFTNAKNTYDGNYKLRFYKIN